MKNLILTLFLSLAVCVTANAQVPANQGYLKSSPTHATTDTVDNAETVNQVINIGGFQEVVTIQPILTKISGTAAGVVRLWGSIDGVNFVRVNPTDSLTMTDVATKTKVFIVSPSAYTHYRISYTGVSTMSVKLQTPAIWRKP